MMRYARWPAAGVAATLTLMFWLPARADAQSKGAESKRALKAAAILDQYVEATGGKKAYEAVTNRVMKGTMEMPTMGLKLDLIAYAAKPNTTYLVAQSAELGRLEEGCAGDFCWENNPLTGPRVLDSAETVDALREAMFDKYANWRAVYADVSLVGQDSVGGTLCDRITATPKQGAPQTLFFDKHSHLLLRVDQTVQHQMGAIPMQMTFGDYKKVGGLLIPHRSVMKLVGQEQVITLTSVAHNTTLPDGIFIPPAAVQALRTKQ